MAIHQIHLTLIFKLANSEVLDMSSMGLNLEYYQGGEALLHDLPENHSDWLADSSENELSLSVKPPVLIVEDDPDQSAFYRVVLNQAGYKAITVSNAFDALVVLKQQKMACVVCDLNMPDFDGRDLAKMLRSSDRLSDIPIIIMSADSKLSEIDLLSAGVDTCFRKNDPLQQLIDEIDLLVWFTYR